ncbi:DsbA family protein [Streptomyces sp. NPDC093109]|uniref:DsbA family protein n=1 Tax=Streptomyces sp. NPDC093109 TaxID=3154977 RepID=UPI003450DF83
MSARNNQSNKAAARERLRLERERQAKKDKVRRQVVVGVSAVAVLAIAGGVGYAVVQANKPSHWEAMKDEKTVVAPKNTEGTDGTTVVIGKSTAKKTLELYEDSRCPICAQFEQTVGPTVQNDIDAGKFRIKYIGATFIDNSDNGTGSKKALSALGAALNVSPEAFLEYKTALYSAKYHPEESSDKFAKDSYLIEVADSVKALKGNTAFQNDVKNGTYDAWAMKMSATFDKSGVQGTPTLKMDGKKLTAPGSDNPPMTVADFNTALTAALKG